MRPLALGNVLLIWLTQLADAAIAFLRKRKHRPFVPHPILGIANFCADKVPTKRALVSLSPAAWQTALRQAPNIEIFNIVGLTFEITKALNHLGYTVDIVDISDADFKPEKHYDFYVGHGGCTGKILDQLAPQTFVLHYASGAYWDAFNRMSQERYENFCARRNLPPIPAFARSLEGTQNGEEKLARRADAAFLSGPRTVATFAGVSRRISLLYLGSYVQKDLLPETREFESGRVNFLYAGGTSGNIQKGLDLALETFARLPHLNLFIYCKVEPETLHAYVKLLSLPNIHYVYHYSIRQLRPKMRSLLSRINFTFGAPIDTGPGTAMLGTFGLGLIPVGYIDIEGCAEDSVLTEECSIESLMDCAQRASEKSASWCRSASAATLTRFAKLHEPSQFGKNFESYLKNMGL